MLQNNVLKFTPLDDFVLNDSLREYHLARGTRTLKVRASFVLRTGDAGKGTNERILKEKCPQVMKLIMLRSMQIEVCGAHTIQHSERDVTYHVLSTFGESNLRKHFITKYGY